MTILETIYTPVGGYAPDFELPGTDEKVHHLSRYLDKFQAVGVVFMCNYCPYVSLYLDKLKKIQREFAASGFTLIGMNGCDTHNYPTESFEQMKAFAERHRLNFPYLWDSTQDVTRSFGAITTPMAFLIDSHGMVRYKGKIDSDPQAPSSFREDYLRNAIAALFKNQAINPQETEPAGTTLIWRN
ncbi:thioredoxin family protein [Nostoc sp. FACHB-87]|uniref:thioredoxin family protein n=1 Tax=Nostocales TaxID=1161 RepID=UPI0016827EB8|nr:MULTISPECIES: thioredoxin family protein [Nostocales]MBD2302065.1 thioredoxin family protein [Nostoc sp. FACHB-190]MBD2455460.1 thioredoxin family protein [Nostoc sp. FACHB-87]MBD2475860.1 thioredoxin family protein [Anabaena sp. FACHB-83]MBD2490815.1 thioredoxin family protein [Aulosira sp. FACHB-615]